MKIYGKCPRCKGALYQDYDRRFKEYYNETLHCLLCGRDWLKANLKEQ